MTEKILYEFDGFRLDPAKGILSYNENLVQLRAKPFQLLLVFVENHGQTLSKETLIYRVWQGASVTDVNFHVNLDKVRKALSETGREPHFILRTANGYKFVGDVKEISSEVITKEDLTNRTSPAFREFSASPEPDRRTQQERLTPSETMAPESRILSNHIWHALLASVLYALMYTDALLLEIAYKWSDYGTAALKLSPAVFTWILISSVVALMLCQRRARFGKATTLLFTAAIFVVAAALLYVGLIFFLPATPVTEAWFQSSTGQAAYLKNVCFYFLPLVVVFLLIPFHSISVLDREVRRGNCPLVITVLSAPDKKTLFSFGLFISSRALGWLLLVAAITSVLLTYRLFDNLKRGPYQNLFSILAILRVMLYFGFGAECLVWYQMALERIRTVCENQTTLIDVPGGDLFGLISRPS